MHSCLYQGNVQHRRLGPVEHAFRYGLYLVYLDLDELPMLLEGGYGLSRAAFTPASFRRADHLGDPQVPLTDAVRGLVQERTGWRPVGPIRLLTLLRNWGYYFNPLSLYYCFAPGTEEVEAVVAEVTNTPWREPLAGVEALAEEVPVLSPSEASPGRGGPAAMREIRH